jgi:hypothetical protein
MELTYLCLNLKFTLKKLLDKRYYKYRCMNDTNVYMLAFSVILKCKIQTQTLKERMPFLYHQTPQ